MKRVLISTLLASVLAVGAGLLLWPRSNTNAQINADGCTCSRPTTLATGREQLSVYYCACPGIQCVVTTTVAGSSAPPNVVQNCRADSFGGPR